MKRRWMLALAAVLLMSNGVLAVRTVAEMRSPWKECGYQVGSEQGFCTDLILSSCQFDEDCN